MSTNIIEQLSANQQQSIKRDSLLMREKGLEACGLIMNNGAIFHCANLAKSKGLDPSQHFVIDSKVYARREAKTKAIYHSHINGNNHFTGTDVELCKATQKSLILYDVDRNQLKAIDPSGNAPLLGREFVYGIYDCYSLIRDYYYQADGITLDDYPRSQLKVDGLLAWEADTWDLFDREYERQGFYSVNMRDIQTGDVLMMSFGGTGKLNHATIYMGNGTLMHQLLSTKSCVEVWGEPWASYTVKVLRHKLWSQSV